MNYTNLIEYGFNDRFIKEAQNFENLYPARVSEQHGGIYKVITENGEIMAGVSGKLMHAAAETADFPAVGDWVMMDRTSDDTGSAVIKYILRRQSAFIRKAAGTSNTTQIVAANIDLVFICMSLNADFNLRRLERYLSIAWDSMATPVVVLTKSDLCDDIQQKLVEIESVSVGADVIVCSCVNDYGFDSVKKYVSQGKTIAFIGSSGVGKSTLINRLIGQEVLKTNDIRTGDDRGRHTTTHRQLMLLPGGGVVIDTPGMREMQVYSGNLQKAFEDIEELAAQCRFKDCSHKSEPGCAVKAAIESGDLSNERFENYLKLKKEAAYDGLNSRQLERQKINSMFGGVGEFKRARQYAKEKNER